MRIARTIGLVAMAALVLAAVAAGSAAATETTLCKNGTVSPYCASADMYPAETTISAGPAIVTLKTPIMDVTCTGSIGGKTTAASGAPLPVSLSSWSFSSCADPEGTVCKAEMKSLPFNAALTHTEGADGSLGLGSGEAGEPRFFVQCGSFMHCEWAPPPVKVKGGSSAQLAVAKTSLVKKGGFLCPSTATLESQDFAVTAPGAVWVARAESPPAATTGLCKALEGWCKPANLYAKGTVLSGSSSDFLIDTPPSWGGGDVSCAKAGISATTNAAYGEPLGLTNSEFWQGECTMGATSCEMKPESTFSGSGSKYNADGRWIGGGASWRLQCGATHMCTFSMPAESLITIEHGTPGRIKLNTSLNRSGSLLCPDWAIMTATFPLSSPSGSLYFTDVER